MQHNPDRPYELALQKAIVYITSQIDDFKYVNPGPYLDRGTLGLTLRALMDCRDRLEEIRDAR